MTLNLPKSIFVRNSNSTVASIIIFKDSLFQETQKTIKKVLVTLKDNFYFSTSICILYPFVFLCVVSYESSIGRHNLLSQNKVNSMSYIDFKEKIRQSSIASKGGLQIVSDGKVRVAKTLALSALTEGEDQVSPTISISDFKNIHFYQKFIKLEAYKETSLYKTTFNENLWVILPPNITVKDLLLTLQTNIANDAKLLMFVQDFVDIKFDSFSKKLNPTQQKKLSNANISTQLELGNYLYEKLNAKQIYKNLRKVKKKNNSYFNVPLTTYRFALDTEKYHSQNIFFHDNLLETGQGLGLVSSYKSYNSFITFITVSLFIKLFYLALVLLTAYDLIRVKNKLANIKLLKRSQNTKNFSDLVGVENFLLDLKQLIHFIKPKSFFYRFEQEIIKIKNVSSYPEFEILIKNIFHSAEKNYSYCPKGFLFTGPPGTGKTLVAKAIAGEANIDFFYTSGSEYKTRRPSEGVKALRGLFKQAKKNSPAIIFIDEIDLLARRRENFLSSLGSKDEISLLTEFLTQVDGFLKREKVIIIGTTNSVKNFDSAFLRPGRFDRIFQFELPSPKIRVKMLKSFCSKNFTYNLTRTEWIFMQQSTTGFSGAELSAIVNESLLKVISQKLKQHTFITLKHGLERITRYSPPKIGNEKDLPPFTKIKQAYDEASQILLNLYFANPYSSEFNPNLLSSLPTNFRYQKSKFLLNEQILLRDNIYKEILYSLASLAGQSYIFHELGENKIEFQENLGAENKNTGLKISLNEWVDNPSFLKLQQATHLSKFLLENSLGSENITDLLITSRSKAAKNFIPDFGEAQTFFENDKDTNITWQFYHLWIWNLIAQTFDLEDTSINLSIVDNGNPLLPETSLITIDSNLKTDRYCHLNFLNNVVTKVNSRKGEYRSQVVFTKESKNEEGIPIFFKPTKQFKLISKDLFIKLYYNSLLPQKQSELVNELKTNNSEIELAYPVSQILAKPSDDTNNQRQTGQLKEQYFERSATATATSPSAQSKTLPNLTNLQQEKEISNFLENSFLQIINIFYQNRNQFDFIANHILQQGCLTQEDLREIKLNR